MNINIGDTVYFIDFDGVKSGKVIDKMDSKLGGPAIVCVRTSSTFKTLEVDSRKLWQTLAEATLALADRKQQEASRLLSEAAGLFKSAGGMREDVANDGGGQLTQ